MFIKYRKPLIERAMIRSLAKTDQPHIGIDPTALAKVCILAKFGDNQYIAEYEGKKCKTIFNSFVSHYYVDDVEGVVSDEKFAQLKDQNK